jgi:hypothetical protein
VATLLIQHEIADFETWRTAFDRLADLRREAGVRQQRVRRPVGEDFYVVIELDFDDAAKAEAFLKLLHEVVWSSAENAPALVGVPKALILNPAEAASG